MNEDTKNEARLPVVAVEAVAVTKEDEDGELYLDWLLEGGICALESPGQVLLIAHGKITDDGGEVCNAADALALIAELRAENERLRYTCAPMTTADSDVREVK